MPYKDKEMKSQRQRERRLKPQSEAPTDNYPAIVHALVDPDKRQKLIPLCINLDKRKLLNEVRYGINGPTFDVVRELFEATTLTTK